MSLSRWSSSTMSNASGSRSLGSASSPSSSSRKRASAAMGPSRNPLPPPRRLCDSSSIDEQTFETIKGIMSDNNCNWHDLYYCMWRAGIVRIDTLDIHTYCGRTLGSSDFDVWTSKGTSSNRTVQNLERAWIKVQLILLRKASFEALLCYLWEQGWRPWLTPSYRDAPPFDPLNSRHGPHYLLTYPFADEQPVFRAIGDIPFPKLKFVPKDKNKDERDRQADAEWEQRQADRPKMGPIPDFSRLPSHTGSEGSFTRPGQAAERPRSVRSKRSEDTSLKAMHDRSESRLSSHYDYQDLPIFGSVNARGQPQSNKAKKRHRLARRFKKKKQPKEKPAGLHREKDGKLMKANPIYQAVKTKRGWF